MPITIPIEGATESPSSTLYYAARSSLDIGSLEYDSALSSVDVISEAEVSAQGSIEVLRDRIAQALSSINMDAYSTYAALQSINIVAGDSFMILADLLAEQLSGPNLGSFAYTDINAELRVNDAVVKIKSFQYQVPTGRLGSILNVRLAEPDVASVPAGATIRFALQVKVGGVTSEYVLIENGKLKEREYQISYQGGDKGGPKDEVSFSSLDVVSDKFGLAPRRSVVMFDPYRVRYDEVSVRNDQMVVTETGAKIRPIIEPVVGLTMKQILQRAYTGIGGIGFMTAGFGTGYNWSGSLNTPTTNQTGCGFTSLVTNIQNYKVRRADFTLEGGWHDGAQPVVSMYAPIYFVEGTILFIIDVDNPLPFGVSAHQITLGSHKVLSERIEYKPDANAVLLTYQYNGNDPSEDPGRAQRDVFTSEVIDSNGVSGDPGYSKTTVRRWDRETYMTGTPDEVLDTLPLSSDTETEQTVSWYGPDGSVVASYVRVTHRETVEYTYEGDLKVSHTREVEATVPDPGAGFLLNRVLVEREECNISWRDDPNNPGVKLQERVRTDVYGLCVYDPDNPETIEDPVDGVQEFVRMIPVLQAQAAGVIADNWVLTDDLIPVSSVRMYLQNTKGNQYDVEVMETDYINNTLKRSYVEPTTGTVSNDPYDAKQRTILLRDLDSEAEIGPRIPVAVNALELPRVRALALGRRVLRRLKDPLMALPITLAGVDFVIDRGSVITGQKRSGYTGNYFATGYSINGDNLGKVGHRVTQTVEATEMLAPEV